MQDGAILCIPYGEWTANADGLVGSVAANRGVVLYTEAQVSALLGHANAADHTGVTPAAIIDTNGLAIDGAGGSWFTFYRCENQPAENYTLQYLLISGEAMTGAGVISSYGLGTIAVVNGCALAATEPIPSSGRRMGLAFSPYVESSVENLESLSAVPGQFTLATPSPTPAATSTIHVGTNFAPLFVGLLVGIGGLPVSPSVDPTTLPGIGSLFANNRCFEEIYTELLPAPLGTAAFLYPVSVTMTADGTSEFGTVVLPVGGVTIVVQAFAVDAAGNLHLSAPGTFH